MAMYGSHHNHNHNHGGVAPLSPRAGAQQIPNAQTAFGKQLGSPTYDPRHEDLNHVALGIWIGSHYVLKSAQPLLSRGIKNVVNAAIEFITENPELINWEDLQRNGIEVHNTMWDDTLAFPIFPSPSLETAVKKIDEVVRAGKNVLVNCAMGKSRSCSLVIAYLMARQNMTYDQALAACKRARPKVNPNANFERQLRQLEASLRTANMNAIPSTPTSPPMSPLASPTAAPAASPLFPPTPTSPTFNHAATVTPASLSNVHGGHAATVTPSSPYGYNRPPYAAGSAIAPPPGVPQSPLRNTAAAPPLPTFGRPTGAGAGAAPATPPGPSSLAHSRSSFGLGGPGAGASARGIGPKYGLGGAGNSANSPPNASPYGSFHGRPGAVSPVGNRPGHNHNHTAGPGYSSFSNLHNARGLHDVGGLGGGAQSGANANMMMRRRSF